MKLEQRKYNARPLLNAGQMEAILVQGHLMLKIHFAFESVRLWFFLRVTLLHFREPSYGTPRMEHDANSEGWVQVIRGPPSEVGSVAQSQVRDALTEGSSGWFKLPARTVEEFLPGRLEQGRSLDFYEFVESRRIRSPSGASGSTTSCQGGDAETGATFFHDTRRELQKLV